MDGIREFMQTNSIRRWAHNERLRAIDENDEFFADAYKKLELMAQLHIAHLGVSDAH